MRNIRGSGNVKQKKVIDSEMSRRDSDRSDHKADSEGAI